MKQSIKQFLLPERRKLVALKIVLLLPVLLRLLGFLPAFYETGWWLMIVLEPLYLLLSSVWAIIGVFFNLDIVDTMTKHNIGFAFFYLLATIVMIIVSYFIICLIFYFYDKLKVKIKTARKSFNSTELP